MDFLIWVFANIGMGFVNLFYVIFHPSAWLDWSNKTSLGHFIHYGVSKEFFFVIFDIFVVISVIGAIYRKFLWAVVRGSEAFANTVGRFFAWASLFMVLQQIMIVFLQRIFKGSEIAISPFGFAFTRDLSWFGEELKLYNAMIVCMAASYTFVQGGHVRVDLFYAGMRHRAKKVVDMFGSLFFIIPFMTIIWMFGWSFMWRHLVTPKVNATKTLEQMERLAPHLKWNVETIGFSPNVVVSLSEDCRTQARIAVEPRTTVYEIRQNKFKHDETISLYFTIRQFPDPNGRFDAVKSFQNQCQIAEELMVDKIIPGFAKPLTDAIAQRRK